MKFEKISLELEEYESLDIISASQGENPTEPVQPETTTKYDPYENDKW